MAEASAVKVDPDSLTKEQKKAIALASARLRLKNKQKQISEPLPSEPTIDAIKSNLTGVGEAGLAFASMSIAEPVAGALGAFELASKLISDDSFAALSAAEQRIERDSAALTFEPKTGKGKKFLQTASIPFQILGEFASESGDRTLRMTGSPAAATAVESGILLAPAVFMGGKNKGVGRRGRDIRSVEKQAKDSGVDLKASREAQAEQLSVKAQEMTEGQFSIGENIEGVLDAIKQAKIDTKNKVDQLYRQARETDASVSSDFYVDLKTDIDKTFNERGFSRDLLHSRTNKILDQIDQLAAKAESGEVSLNEISRLREKINQGRPPSTEPKSLLAQSIIKGKLDALLEARFNADMISGSPEALAKWKKARAANEAYHDVFTRQKTIKAFAEQEIIPEGVSNWIFGTSQTGRLKPQAGQVVKELKKVLGEDSPQFAAIRQEAIFRIVDPLFDQPPNLKQFVKNYDSLVRNNKTVVQELFPDSMGAMSDMRRLAEANLRRKNAPFNKFMDSDNVIANFAGIAFGHGIARGRIRVSFAARAMGALKDAVTKTERRKMMAEVLGYDPFAPALNKSFATNAGIIKGAQEEGTQ